MPVQVRGLSEAIRRLTEAPQRFRDRILNLAMRKGARVALSAISRSAPVRTGTLRASLRTYRVRTREKERVRYYVATTGKGFYGRFVELGTTKMRAEPWMEPAFDAVSGQVEQTIAEEIVRLIDSDVAWRA